MLDIRLIEKNYIFRRYMQLFASYLIYFIFFVEKKNFFKKQN